MPDTPSIAEDLQSVKYFWGKDDDPTGTSSWDRVIVKYPELELRWKKIADAETLFSHALAMCIKFED